MQDGYAGDIGDYGKFALLRTIARTTSLRLGLDWYRTNAGSNDRDGRFITYATTPAGERRHRPPDPELFDALRSLILSGVRSVAALESLRLLAPESCCYFSELLSYDGIPLNARLQHRKSWFVRGQSTLARADVVLLDPDNGFEVRSTSIRRATAPKYVFIDEATALRAGRSLIVYQHGSRTGTIDEQIARGLQAIPGVTGAFAIRHHCRSPRAYLFFPAPAHRAALRRATDALLERWPGHFTVCGV